MIDLQITHDPTFFLQLIFELCVLWVFLREGVGKG